MCSHSSHKNGFTLIELLVVIALMAIIASIGVPAFFSLNKSGKMNQATSELAGILEGARQYAAAQNTFVWVTFNTQTTDNIDTLNVAVVASTDGTDPGAYGQVPGANFNLISKVRTFRQIQLKSAGTFTSTQLTSLPTSPVTGSGNALSSSAVFNIAIPATATVASFTQSIEFTPSGEARNTTSPIDIIEFGLEPAQSISTPNASNVAVVRVNGITGQASVYRR